MPKLPVGESQASYTTDTSLNRQDPRAAGQAGRDLQALGGGFISLGEQLGKVQDVWDKAKVTNQYTTARNNRKAEMNQLLSEAERDPDHENAQFYLDRVEKLSSEDVTIEDENVKGLYGLEVDLDTKIAYTKLREVFRSKMITHQRGEILKDSEGTKEAYMTGDAIDRANIIPVYKDRLKTYKDAGYLTNEEYQSELLDMDDWEFDRAMRMAGNNPEGALELIESPKSSRRNQEEGFKIKDEGKLNKVVDMARSTLARHNKIREIATLQSHVKNQTDLRNILDDPTVSHGEKMEMVSRMDRDDMISSTFAASARRHLTDKQELERVVNNPESSRLIRMMYDANVNYEDDLNERQYLKKLNAIQSEIMGAKVPVEDRLKLQKYFDNITQKKTAEATLTLGKFGSKDMKKADEYFKSVLPAHTVNEALRTFFNRTIDQDLSQAQANKIMKNITLETESRNRSDVQDAYDEAREKVGRNADLRMMQAKDGGFSIILYKNGKPVKPVADVGPPPRKAE